jgi:hypothetical protein
VAVALGILPKVEKTRGEGQAPRTQARGKFYRDLRQPMGFGDRVGLPCTKPAGYMIVDIGG